jgi:hypothetical protein
MLEHLFDAELMYRFEAEAHRARDQAYLVKKGANGNQR